MKKKNMDNFKGRWWNTWEQPKFQLQQFWKHLQKIITNLPQNNCILAPKLLQNCIFDPKNFVFLWSWKITFKDHEKADQLSVLTSMSVFSIVWERKIQTSTKTHQNSSLSLDLHGKSSKHLSTSFYFIFHADFHVVACGDINGILWIS